MGQTYSNSSHQCFIARHSSCKFLATLWQCNPHYRRDCDDAYRPLVPRCSFAVVHEAKGDFYLHQRLRRSQCYRPLSAARNSKFPAYFHVLYIHVIRRIAIYFSAKLNKIKIYHRPSIHRQNFYHELINASSKNSSIKISSSKKKRNLPQENLYIYIIRNIFPSRSRIRNPPLRDPSVRKKLRKRLLSRRKDVLLEVRSGSIARKIRMRRDRRLVN